MKFITQAMLRVMVLLAILPPLPAAASNYGTSNTYSYVYNSYQPGYAFADAYGSWTYQGEGIWLGASGARFTLREWYASKWDPYCCCHKQVLRYEFIPVPVALAPAPVVNVKAPDFWEILAKDLGQQKESELRLTALATFYPDVATQYGQTGAYRSSRVDLYGGAQYPATQPQYAPIDLNIALAQQGLNIEAVAKALPGLSGLQADTIKAIGMGASDAALLSEVRQLLVQVRQAAKPAATIETKEPVLPPAVQPVPAPQQMPRISISFEERFKIAERHLFPGSKGKHMPEGGQLTSEEIRLFVNGSAADVAAIDGRHRCTECHAAKGVKVSLR